MQQSSRKVCQELAPQPGREDAFSELPTIAIPQDSVAPTPESPIAPPLLPVRQPQSGQVFTPMRGVQTFLLMGSDKRDHDATWRTDVVIIAVLDQRRNRGGHDFNTA